MRTCRGCEESKPLEDFPRDLSTKSGYGSRCRVCRAAYARQWRHENPDKANEHQASYRKTGRKTKTAQTSNYQAKRTLLDTTKTQAGCLRCGENDPICLSFHHIRPSEKSFGLGEFVGKSLQELEQEMKKCVVLCENCHRKLHAGRWELPID